MRRTAVGLMGLAACLAVGLTAVVSLTGPSDGGQDPAPPPPITRAASAPNIVLITTDDQTLADLRWMPKTRKLLGRQGVTFRQMLSPHPLCCPARAEIITGQYAQNNGVYANSGPYGGVQALRRPDSTLAAWLQRSGYHTALVGKYLNGYQVDQGVPTGWEYWNAAAKDTFGYYGYSMVEDGQLVQYGPADTYSTDLVTQESQHQIRTFSSDTQNPFFVWASYYAPHGECTGRGEGCHAPPTPARRHRDRYPNARSPSLGKPSFNEADVSDKPGRVSRLGKVSPAHIQRVFRRRIQALASVDQGVEQILRTLREVGELDDTVLMFTSDNGYLTGEHRYEGKVLGYEEALRVPLLIRGPGIPADEVSRQAVTTLDLTATVVALSGVTPDRPLDGRDLTPVAASPASHRDRTVLIQAGTPGNSEHPRKWLFRGVRTDRYTLVRWVGSQHFVELYDRARDRFQLVNIAGDPRYEAVQAELERRTDRLETCSGPDCNSTFGPMPEPS